jgi:hypothetical protein
LIGNDHSNAELISDPLEHSQVLRHMHLSRSKLTSAGEVSSVESSGRVNHHQRKSVLSHKCGCLQEQLVLLVCIVGTRIGNVIKHLLFIKAETLRNGDQPLRAESSFSVDVHGHSLTTTFSNWKLASDAECMADLCLSRSKLTEDLSDSTSLHSTSQQLVKRLTSSTELHHGLPLFKISGCSLESKLDDL